jgi:dTDP-4-dehydrorhamnose reductase
VSTRTGPSTRRPVVILGAQGQIGFELVRSLKLLGPVVAFARSTLDITNSDSLRATLAPINPLVILNAAAYTAVDQAKEEPDIARAANSTAPGVLAAIAEECGSCLIHYSTDYVFDGNARRPYRESDPVSPANIYSQTKLAGEHAVMENASAAIILRTCWVYSNRGHNFLRTMQRLAGENQILRVVDDQIGCPTPAHFVAQATAEILAGCGFSFQRLRERRGIYHLAASGQTSWCEFARAIFRESPGLARVAIHGIKTSQYPTAAKRPAYSVLDTARVCKEFSLSMPGWEFLLKQTLKTHE